MMINSGPIDIHPFAKTACRCGDLSLPCFLIGFLELDHAEDFVGVPSSTTEVSAAVADDRVPTIEKSSS